MKNTTILEMVNNGEYEILKKLLMEEIYQDSLNKNINARSRYAAMKRFFRYKSGLNNDSCNKPCKDINIDNVSYTSFLDGYCFVLTTENTETLSIDFYDNTKNSYMNVKNLIDFNTYDSIEKIDLNSVLANAKSKGYKHKKSELDPKDYIYVFNYKDSYYKVALLDKAFSIINDGEQVELYYKGKNNVLLIKNDIGIAGIMPMNTKSIDFSNKTIIKAE